MPPEGKQSGNQLANEAYPEQVLGRQDIAGCGCHVSEYKKSRADIGRQDIRGNENQTK